jgi:hypothetical protein
MAGPLIILYEVSIISVSLFAKKRFFGYAESEDQGESDENRNVSDPVEE